MVTIGSKLYFGLSGFFLLAALVYGFSSSDSQFAGVITGGFVGAIGEPLGYGLLLFLSAIAFGLGVVTTAFRDADPTAQAQVAGLDVVPEVTPPAGPSGWPVVGAFGAAILLVGLVVEPFLAWIGIALIVASAVEWTVSNWAARATGDPEVNRAIRNRIMLPIEIPAVGLFGIAVFVLSASRVLLAVEKVGATVIFAVAAALILATASLLAARPQVTRSLLTALLLVGGVALVGGGIAGLAAGERDFKYLGPKDDNEQQAEEPVEEAGAVVTISNTED